LPQIGQESEIEMRALGLRNEGGEQEKMGLGRQLSLESEQRQSLEKSKVI